MPDHLHVETLFHGPLVTILDVRCRPHEMACGGEEISSAHQMVFPRAGAFLKHSTRRGETLADPTRILLFNRGEPYRVSHPVCGGDDCTAIRFDENALFDFMQSRASGVSRECLFSLGDVGSSAESVLALQRLRQHVRQPGGNALRTEEICAALLARATLHAQRMAGARRVSTQRFHRELVRRVRVLLASRFREKLTLGDLARASFSSPFHLARLFRAHTGSTLHSHQTRLRLRHALEAVVEGALDLTALALDLGFSSHAHFSDAFRREFRITPSALRKNASTALLREMRNNLKV